MWAGPRAARPVYTSSSYAHGHGDGSLVVADKLGARAFHLLMIHIVH